MSEGRMNDGFNDRAHDKHYADLPDPSITERDEMLLYKRAQQLVSDGHHDEALDVFYASWRLYPLAPTAYRIGQLHRMSGNIESARSWTRRAYETRRHQDNFAITYAQDLTEQGLFHKASSVVDEILLRNHTYGPAIRLKETLARAMRGGGSE